MSNAYEMTVEGLRKADQDGEKLLTSRPHLIHRYGWAIPNDKAIEVIVHRCQERENEQGLVEMGAGVGYWSWLLATYKPPQVSPLRVTAVDRKPAPPHSEWVHDLHYVVAGPGYLETHGPCHLLLCWPPENDPMATRSLYAWLKSANRRSTLFYVGEGPGGCTGDAAFHRGLSKLTLVETVDIPRYPGNEDTLTIYRKP